MDFPRVHLPFEVSELSLPGPLISKAQSGRVNTRSNLQIGRTWRESFLLKVSDTTAKLFLAQVRNYWRNGQIFEIAHRDYLTIKGTGGGSPVVNAATQLVTTPETFASWTDIATPVLTAGQSDPFGGTAAVLFNDNDAGAFEGKYHVVSFTGNGTKCVAVYIKQGSSTVHRMALRSDTGPTYRGIWDATWAAGVPSLSIISGSLTLYTPEQHPVYPLWWRVAVAVPSVVASETNRIELYTTTATVGDTGTGYYFGANAWNEVSPARYSGPSNPNNDATGNVLYVNGATASTSNWLRGGDLFSVPVGEINYVLEAGADVSTQANGYAPIPITPPLFTGGTPSDNAALTLSSVKMRCVILEPPSWPDTSGNGADFGELSLVFGEAL